MEQRRPWTLKNQNVTLPKDDSELTGPCGEGDVGGIAESGDGVGWFSQTHSCQKYRGYSPVGIYLEARHHDKINRRGRYEGGPSGRRQRSNHSWQQGRRAISYSGVRRGVQRIKDALWRSEFLIFYYFVERTSPILTHGNKIRRTTVNNRKVGRDGG